MTKAQRIRKLLKARIDNLPIRLFYYDRKEDEDLTVEDIQWAQDNDIFTNAELVEWFAKALYQ